VEPLQGDEGRLAMTGTETNLVPHYFQLVPRGVVGCGLSEGALKGNLNEVDDLRPASSGVLWSQHLGETCKGLVQDFYLFLGEVDTFALKWVCLPERAFELMAMV